MADPFECLVCLQSYDEAQHRPMMLPCGHTICVSDLRSLLTGPRSNPLCPLCRSPLPTTQPADKFPTNYQLLQAQASAASTAAAAAASRKLTTPDQSPSPSSPATSPSSGTSGPVNSSSGGGAGNSAALCSVQGHDGQPLTLFCSECETVLCPLCLLQQSQQHQSHRTALGPLSAQRPYIQADFDRLTALLKYAEGLQTAADVRQSDCAAAAQQAVEQVRQASDRIIQATQKRSEALQRSVQEAADRNRKAIESALQGAQPVKEALQRANQQLTTLLGGGKDADLAAAIAFQRSVLRPMLATAAREGGSLHVAATVTTPTPTPTAAPPVPDTPSATTTSSTPLTATSFPSPPPKPIPSPSTSSSASSSSGAPVSTASPASDRVLTPPQSRPPFRFDDAALAPLLQSIGAFGSIVDLPNPKVPPPLLPAPASMTSPVSQKQSISAFGGGGGGGTSSSTATPRVSPFFPVAPSVQNLLNGTPSPSVQFRDRNSMGLLDFLKQAPVEHIALLTPYARPGSQSAPADPLIASSSANLIRIWDSSGGFVRSMTTQEFVQIRSLSASGLLLEGDDAGPLVAAGCDDGNIRVWAVATGRCVRTVSAHVGAVSAMTFLPPQPSNPTAPPQLLTAGDDSSVRVWEVPTFVSVRSVAAHTRAITNICACRVVASSPSSPVDSHADQDPATVATNIFCVIASADNLKLWNLSTGQFLRTLAHGASQVYLIMDPNTPPSPPGVRRWPTSDNLLIVATDRGPSARVWDVRTGSCFHVLTPRHTQQQGLVRSLISQVLGHSILISDSTDPQKPLWLCRLPDRIELHDVMTGSLVRVLITASSATKSLASSGPMWAIPQPDASGSFAIVGVDLQSFTFQSAVDSPSSESNTSSRSSSLSPIWAAATSSASAAAARRWSRVGMEQG